MSELEESKIVSPFMPTLLHFANVKIAVSFLDQLEERIVKEAFDSTSKEQGNNELSRGTGVRSLSSRSEQWLIKFQRAREVFLLVPAHLRDGVMKAVYGLRNTAMVFQSLHSKYMPRYSLSNGDFVVYWRSDGSVDKPKTVQSLILDVNIAKEKRFLLACKYCLEEDVLNLWPEIEAEGKTEYLELDRYCMAHFWVSWMRSGRRVPWRQAAAEYFTTRTRIDFGSRFSAFVPSLLPEEREMFLRSIRHSDKDDYLQCLYALSKENEEQILKQQPLRLLWIYSFWPLQSLLVATAEKMWSYLSEADFCVFLHNFLSSKSSLKDFDYYQLFGQLWDKSPDSFTKRAKQTPILAKNIDLWLDEIKKRKQDSFNGRRNKLDQ